MKTLRLIVAIAATLVSIMAYAQDKINITVNGRTLTATLADTEAARQLKAKLEAGPITVSMQDYGGFEKVGELPWELPANDTQITTVPGDIMLYHSMNIVIFYGSNSWAYTPLGKIDGAGADEIRNFLAGSPAQVTFTADVNTGISSIDAEATGEPTVYNLQGHRIRLDGRKVTDLPAGVYIVDGKKQIVK